MGITIFLLLFVLFGLLAVAPLLSELPRVSRRRKPRIYEHPTSTHHRSDGTNEDHSHQSVA